jgi:ADP-ribosylglycohydrolase
MSSFLCSFEKDKIMGMFWAHAIGDALLAPYEALSGNRTRPTEYVERMTESTVYRRKTRFGHYCEYMAGQGTDDSEMTRILLKHVVHGNLDSSLILSYISWANSGTESLGRNTRRLLHGFKGLKTYWKRFETIFGSADAMKKMVFGATDAMEGQQSNGHLMRCSPLALIDDPEDRNEAIRFDCGITNPSSVCFKVTVIYVEVLRALLQSGGSDFAVAERLLEKHAAEAEGPLKQALVDGLCRGPFPRKMTGKDKGWTLNSLSAAFYFARTSATFTDGMRSVVRLGGDTDTNGCILGALLGARFGLRDMQTEAPT